VSARRIRTSSPAPARSWPLPAVSRLLLAIPDPYGLLGFAIVVGALFSHLSLEPRPGGYLWSENLVLEAAGHVWLLLGPFAGAILGVKHLIVHGTSPFPVVSVPLGFFLGAAGCLGAGLGLVLSAVG
jgi:hypothetical protein